LLQLFAAKNSVLKMVTFTRRGVG